MVRSFVVAVVAVLVVTGCGAESCPAESPKTSDFVQDTCTAGPGQPVPLPLTLCPTCNQVVSSCSGDQIGENAILLDPIVEACTNDTCNEGPTCDLPSTCTFTAPSAPGIYDVQLLEDPDAALPEFWHATLTVEEGSGTGACTIGG